MTIDSVANVPAHGATITAVSTDGRLVVGVVVKSYMSVGVAIANPITREVSMIEDGTEYANVPA